MSDHEAAIDASFGAWLRERRKALGLTQEDLARYVGCSLSTIRKLERDERRPSAQVADLLADTLKLSPDQRELFRRVARGRLPVYRLFSPALKEGSDSRPASTLPVPPTPLVGREPELDALVQLIGDPQCRLLTLLGPGGIGKTRLAIAAAGRQEDAFREGACFVALGPLASASFLVPAIAHGLGLVFRGPDEPRHQLLTYLRPKQMLLFLDNFEHLLDGVELLAEILLSAPEVKLLTTSRESLRLQGEWVFEVQGLPVPADGPAELVEEYSAVKLFVQSARRARADFALRPDVRADVARICRLVEGMPLGIELAAAWVSALTCPEIACEIERGLDFLATSSRDVPARQRSLRAVFDHSWSLLPAAEQALLARLAVFQGDFNRPAAEQVAGATLPSLLALLSKSLVRRTDTGGYNLHPVVRQFAAEKLSGRQEYGELREIHSHYFLDLLHGLEADVKGKRQVAALDEIDAVLDDVAVAWQWALDHGDESGVDRALETLYTFFTIRARHHQGVQFLRQTTVSLALDGTSLLAGRLLGRQALLHCNLSTAGPEVLAEVNQALALARQGGDPLEIGVALLALGYYYTWVQRDAEQVRVAYEQSLAACQAAGDSFYVARALHRIGYCHDLGHRPSDYIAYTQQSLATARAAGNNYDAAWALHNLAASMLLQGEYAVAETYLHDSITMAEEAHDLGGPIFTRAWLALLHLLNGDLDTAGLLATRCLVAADEIDAQTARTHAKAVLAMHAAVKGESHQALEWVRQTQAQDADDPTSWLALWAAAIAHGNEHDFEAAARRLCLALEAALADGWAGYVAWCLPIGAVILARQGEPARAAELLALASTHRASLAGWLAHWAPSAQLADQLRQLLGPEGFQRAWERGRALDLQAAAREWMKLSAG